MTQVTIELPDSFIVAMRNGASVDTNPVALFAKLGTEIALYGLGQVLRDSASGAAKAAEAEGSKGVEAEAQAMLDSKLANLVEGKWTVRGEGGLTDPRVLVAHSVVRGAMKAKLGAKSAKWLAFIGLADADQLAKLDENYAANESVFKDAVDTELARRQSAAKAKAALAKGATFNI